MTVTTPGAARVALALVALLLGCAANADSAARGETELPANEEFADARPDTWAAPLDVPGLPNLHRVDDGLYRSAQPTADGMRAARALGVRTVVNLRSFHSDRDEISDTGLAYEHLYVKAWHPETKEVVRFLQIATDPARRPVLVHCQHGADRTGIMSAAYRICVQGWSKADAIAELTAGGYGFHAIWFNLIDFVEELDVDDVRRRAGLDERGSADVGDSAQDAPHDR